MIISRHFALKCILLCIVFSAARVKAQVVNQPVWEVYGAGNLTCGKWTLAREIKNEMQVELMKQWVAGWVVSYNYYLTERTGKGRVSTPDFDTITAYLDKYCAEKPLTVLALAPAQMIQDLGGATAFHNRRRPADTRGNP